MVVVVVVVLGDRLANCAACRVRGRDASIRIGLTKKPGKICRLSIPCLEPELRRENLNINRILSVYSL